MIRAQVQLTEEQLKRLRRLSSEKNVSLSALVRQGVDILLKTAKEVDRQERWRRALSSVGQFRSGKGDLARRHDDYFAESIDS